MYALDMGYGAVLRDARHSRSQQGTDKCQRHTEHLYAAARATDPSPAAVQYKTPVESPGYYRWRYSQWRVRDRWEYVLIYYPLLVML